MARIGLEHLHAGHCDPGWNGSVLTLELVNLTQFHSIRIRPGDAIGQMIFYKVEEVSKEQSYSTVGRYNGDKSVSGIKL
jgi:deoxycytidine triphosphate deaminase